MPWLSPFGVEVPDDEADKWNTLLQRAQEFRAGGLVAPITTDEPTTGQLTVSATGISTKTLEEATEDAANSLNFYFNSATGDEVDIPTAARLRQFHNAEAAWAALSMVLFLRGILKERFI